MHLFLTLFSIVFFASQASASIVEYAGNPVSVPASGQKVLVHPEAKLATPDGTLALKLSGHGIRTKSILLVKVNVYLAASYVEDPKALNSSDPLAGIQSSKGKILKLTLLRAMSGADIRSSFEESLDYNGVDLNETAIANVFEQFNFSGNAGDTFTLIGYPGSGSLERLVIELPNKTIEEEGKDLSFNFWKVWFGKPLDSGLETLKKALTGKN